MKKLLLSTVFALGVASSSALAADMPYPVKAPPAVAMVPPFSWTGFYLGANVGYGWGDFDNWRGKHDSAGLEDRWYYLPAHYSQSADGWIAGGQAGYNYQFSNNVVIGVEADFQWSGIEARGPSAYASADFREITTTETTSLEWFGTLRGRLGYAFDRLLVYGTGGLAYGKIEMGFMDEYGYGRSYSDTRWGWTAGGGVEWAFADNWSLKAEYLYIDLGTFSQGDFYGQLPNGYGIYTDRSVDAAFHTVKIGVNYRF